MHPRRILLSALITFLVTILVAPGSAILDWHVIHPSVANQTAIAQTPQQQPLTLYQPIQDIPWEGQFVNPLGIAYFASEEVIDGYLMRVKFEGELQIARTIGDRQPEAEALFNIGLGYQVEREFDRAIAAYKESLEVARDLSDGELNARILGNLGLAYAQVANYADAVDYLNQYRIESSYNSDPQLSGVALSNLGNVYYAADLYAQAIQYYQQRLAFSQKINDRLGEGKALSNLGLVAQSLGDNEKAIAYQQQSLAIAKQTGDRLIEKRALSNLGIAYHTQGDYSKAIEYQQQALAIATAIRDGRGEAQALSNLGGAYYFLGHTSKAIESYQQSLERALEIQAFDIAAIVRGNLGLIYLQQKDYDKAIEFYQQYLRSAWYSDNRRLEGIARNNLAAAYLNAGNLAKATEILFEAINVWESLRTRLGSNDAYKVSILDTQSAAYVNLQRLLIAQNQIEAALEISERGRARAFVELLARRISPETAASEIPPLTIEQIKQIAKTQNVTLVEYSIIQENFTVQGKPQTRESELYIWVVKPTGEVLFRKVDLKPLWQQQNLSLEDLVINTRDSMGVEGRGLSVVEREEEPLQRQQQLAKLYDLLIQPIAELLPTDPASPVVFIPQGSLFLVPFDALQDATGKYLIEKHTIVTAASIQVLNLTLQQRQRLRTREQGNGGELSASSTSPFLVVGNPTMPSIPPAIGETPQPLPSLPGAEREALEIAQVLNTQAFTGNQATKSAILPKMMQARIIHLATHGLLDDFTGQGVPGAIALAPDPSPAEIQGVNGLLTASEILDLKLRAELAVLSACDTGRGRITGDGVIGLSRSLITAGVPSVIVSLWAVPDAPTASLMTEFYRNLQQNPDKAQALRNAKLTTMQQNPQPRDWAAFTLIGESD